MISLGLTLPIKPRCPTVVNKLIFQPHQDITLRLSSHPQAHHVLNAPLALPQLRSLTAHLNSALDIIDVTRWTGDPTSASFISGQLRLLSDCLADARGALRGGEDVVLTEGVVERDALIGNEGEGQDTDEVVAARSSRRELKKWFEEGGDCDPEVSVSMNPLR